jgi:hypothetical protein
MTPILQSHRVPLAAAALAILCIAPVLSAQQKYRLQDTTSTGDVSMVSERMSMSMKVQGTVEGKKFQRQFTRRAEEDYREEVLVLGGGAALTHLRRVYSLNREFEKEGSAAEKRTVSSLEGKTIDIRRQGGKTSISALKGQIAAKDRKELIDHFKDPDPPFFPDREVAPGDEWALDPQAAARLFEGAENATILCHFQDVVDYSGRKCAHVRVTMTVTEEPEDLPIPMTMKLTGVLYHAIDLQRTLAVDMSGTIGMKAENNVDGRVDRIDGSGRMTLKMTARWLKVAGQAVGGPGPAGGTRHPPAPSPPASGSGRAPRAAALFAKPAWHRRPAWPGRG